MSVFGEVLASLGLAKSAPPARASQTTPYVGMDQGVYFGAGALDYFQSATNMVWVGGYLDSPATFTGEIEPPGHPSNARKGHQRGGSQSWDWQQAGLHEARAHGWGVLPIYWGQQDPANADGPWDVRPLAAEENAKDAIEKAKAANLDPHTVIYIDWETSGAPSAAGIAYLALWFELVAAEGYRPGLYAHNEAITKMRDRWPEIAGWATNPWVTAKRAVISPRVGPQVRFVARDPAQSGQAADRDNLAWQMWFTSETPWPSGLVFPTPGATATFPIKLANGSTAINAAGTPVMGLDVSCSSVADPGFPERRMAPGLIRRGRFSAAILDPSTIATYAVRRGALLAGAWTSATPTATTTVALPDHRLAYNPYSPHAAATRGTAGDLAVIARSSLAGTAQDAWQLHAYRRRGTTWSFDSNINDTTPIEPLLGVSLVARESSTLKAFFATNDGTHRIFVVSCIDAATQADSQLWAAPVEVPMPAGELPSLVGGIGAASRAAGTVDVFTAARPAAGEPHSLFWSSSSILGTWPAFSVPADPATHVHPFSNIAAISRGPELVDVFAIAKGPNDASWILYTWWWNKADSWGAAPPGGVFHTQPIVGSTVRPHPVSKLAAVSRGEQYIDVFVVGHDDGLLYTVHWDQTANAWSDFARVGTNAITVGSVDGAFSRDPSSLEVMVTGRDGNVYVSSWNTTTSTFSDLARIAQFNLGP